MNNSLVSVVVVSYNSASTILETLESIKNQTYQEIELIITDDCSKDETVSVCQEWLAQNKDRFVSFQLITSPVNTGVCANGNRGRFAAKGEWLKGIAGDDILLPNCISDYICFAQQHPGAKFMTAFRRIYNETFDEVNFVEEEKGIGDNSIYEKGISEQLHACVKRLLAQGATMFYAKEVFEKVGGFDTKYPFEDYPFTINALECGYKVFLVPKATIGYRVHQSICHTKGKLFNWSYKKKVRPFFENKCFTYLSDREVKGIRKIWALEDFLGEHNLDNYTRVSNFLYQKILAIIHKIYR